MNMKNGGIILKKLNIVKQDVAIQVEMTLEELGTITALVGVSTASSRTQAANQRGYKIINEKDDVKFYDSLLDLYKEASK